MSDAIGVRLDKETIEKIEKLSEENVSDRSTTIRQLVQIGYKDVMTKKAMEKYIRGDITISEAARLAEMTIWEMERALVEHGYKSEYSIDDLRRELKII